MEGEKYVPGSSTATGGINKPIYPAERAKMVLAQCEGNLLKNFKGLYSNEEIQHDIDHAERLKKKFGEPPIKKYGDIFEAVMYEQGAKSEWWGANTQMVKTALYDDYINKIDLVVETRDAAGQFTQLALGVDVTFGSQDLTDKFMAIRGNIDKGELGHLKYFFANRPKGMKFAGALRNIPHVVVGMEVDRVTELGRIWVDPRREGELAVHPIQMIVLEQAVLELEAFRDYAARAAASEKTKALAPILDKKLQEVEALLKDKRAAEMKTFPHDAVFEEIKRNLLHFYVTPDAPPAKSK